MRILLTGAAGYIASWLKPELEAHGHTVLGTDRPEDLVEAPSLALRVIERAEPELVVHLAAGIGRELCEADWSKTVRANVELTVQVARATATAGARMLQVSTSEVYGPARSWQGVDSPKRPINLYGWTKLWAEQAAQFYAGAGVARLSMPYGPGATPGPGKCALHNFLWEAWCGRPLYVHANTWRSWTWAGDTAAGLRLMIEQAPGAVMNIGRSDDLRRSVDVAELACKVVAEMGGPRRSVIESVPVPPDVTPVKDYDTVPLQALGWAPTVELEDGMQRTLAAWLGQGHP